MLGGIPLRNPSVESLCSIPLRNPSAAVPDLIVPCCGQYGQINRTDPRSCQQLCVADPVCVSWTFQPLPNASGMGRCAKLSGLSNTAQTLWRPPIHAKGSTSGVIHASKFLGGRTSDLQLSPHDTSVNLRVYVDNVISEGFWQGGRVAVTRRTDAAAQAGMALHSTAALELQSATVWRVLDARISTEQVLRNA
jgi:hypothetical protein